MIAKRILVVDDCHADRLLAAHVLAMAGYAVELAHDGGAAWELIQQLEFDAVVADWEMPRVDGPELLRRMRASARFARLPVILNTGCDDARHRAAGIELGADGYIAKGRVAARDELLESLRRLLG